MDTCSGIDCVIEKTGKRGKIGGIECLSKVGTGRRFWPDREPEASHKSQALPGLVCCPHNQSWLPELLLFHGTSSPLDWALDPLIMISATEIPIYIALFVIPHDMHRLKWFLHIKWTFWAFCAGEWTRQVWPVRVRSFDERMWSSRECYFFCYLESCSDYYVAILGLHLHQTATKKCHPVHKEKPALR